MPLTAQLYVKHPDLALSPTIRSLPDADVGVVSDAGTDPRNDVFFYWIEAADFHALEETLAEDHTVSAFAAIIEDEERRTYRVEYSDAAMLISPSVTDIGGVILDSRSHVNGWLLDLLLPDHDGLYQLNEDASAEGITLEVVEVKQTDAAGDGPDFGLTEPQREALVAAFLHGYYEEPREVFLEDLANLLGVSPTAVSGRLRRGSARIIEEAFIEDETG